uniref:Uncharacterized protein n=1 Tax=Arundo donax TaxID=35708 RepID=A0A0A9AIY6_ARUDO
MSQVSAVSTRSRPADRRLCRRFPSLATLSNQRSSSRIFSCSCREPT